MAIHKVREGETLSKIAKKYNTTATAIQIANPIIKNVNVIQVGWVLNIPDKAVSDAKVKNALNKCLDAIDQLPEFHNLLKML